MAGSERMQLEQEGGQSKKATTAKIEKNGVMPLDSKGLHHLWFLAKVQRAKKNPVKTVERDLLEPSDIHISINSFSLVTCNV